MTLDAPRTDAELLAMLEQRTRKRAPEPTLRSKQVPHTSRHGTPADRQANRASEHEIQSELIQWADANVSRFPELALLFAIPNGGKRSIGMAVKLKKEGVKSGVPDLCLPVARKGFTGLWVEMKKPGGTTSPAQAHWLAALAMHGHKVALCTSPEAAQSILVDYLTAEAA